MWSRRRSPRSREQQYPKKFCAGFSLSLLLRLCFVADCLYSYPNLCRRLRLFSFSLAASALVVAGCLCSRCLRLSLHSTTAQSHLRLPSTSQSRRLPLLSTTAQSLWLPSAPQNHDHPSICSSTLSKFIIHPSETDEIKKWILHNMGKKWRTWKGSLKALAYDPSLTIDEIVAQRTKNDDRVNPTQFKELVTRWFDPEFQSTCDVKRSSRSKMNEPHVTGTKSFARLAHEMAMDNNGVYPTRGEMYVTTRTRKDGSIVDFKAAEVVASLKAFASESTSTPGDEDDFTNDDYSRVKGPEKRGYVRLVGRMPSVKKSGDSSTDSQTIHQLKSVVNVMLNIIQEHIPNANLSSVLSHMNIEVPGIPLISNNSQSINQRSPSGSGTNNGN